MARQKLDITGTAKEAEARGVSRRTIQRERARLRETAEAAVVQAREAAEKAGWLERAAQYRLREALTRGDAAATKLFASTLLDIWKVIEKVEPLADRRVGQLKMRLEERVEIENDFDKYLATHGPAYIRAHQPSPTECLEGAVRPMTQEEIERWNAYHEEQERREKAAAEERRRIQAEQAARIPGPCERELLERAKK
ncbi:MAG: hypothetical protein EBZ78_04130 [Verrucomicrobia bacterium]|nr:hypothetical protein [Verrucomicrobiota bacterium]